ncbi:hypothetical protein D9611_007430 [Ephemerocybe angulata]|uniref:Uncharacterized protein n=1 Tax=Ephemerocybe angulata TaxID=980116 RepID=A0A8H5FL80_9AGAR|nr:hypothetical protein D9611_007430 [Tulosesus angulatus]
MPFISIPTIRQQRTSPTYSSTHPKQPPHTSPPHPEPPSMEKILKDDESFLTNFSTLTGVSCPTMKASFTHHLAYHRDPKACPGGHFASRSARDTWAAYEGGIKRTLEVRRENERRWAEDREAAKIPDAPNNPFS